MTTEVKSEAIHEVEPDVESDIWTRREPKVIALMKFNEAIKEWVGKQGDAIIRNGGKVQLKSTKQLMEVFELAKSFGISEEQLGKLKFGIVLRLRCTR